MKIFHESKYTFLGKYGAWYVFEAKKYSNDFDPEIVLVKRARMILENGQSRFFDPINESHDKKGMVEYKNLNFLEDIYK